MAAYILDEWAVREKLSNCGLTIARAAASLDVDRATLSAQINGLRPASLAVALELGDLLGVDNVRELVKVAPVGADLPKNAAGLALSLAAAPA